MTLKTRATMVLAVAIASRRLAGVAQAAYAQPPRERCTRGRSTASALSAMRRQTSTLARSGSRRRALRARRRASIPASGYSDNALWQAGSSRRLACDRFGETPIARPAVRLLKQLQSGYPSSSLLQGSNAALARFDARQSAVPDASAATQRRLWRAAAETSSRRAVTPTREDRASRQTCAEARASAVVTLRGIIRASAASGRRPRHIEMDARASLSSTSSSRTRGACSSICRARSLSPALRDTTLTFDDDSCARFASAGIRRTRRVSSRHRGRRVVTASSRSTTRTAWSSISSAAQASRADARSATVPRQLRQARAAAAAVSDRTGRFRGPSARAASAVAAARRRRRRLSTRRRRKRRCRSRARWLRRRSPRRPAAARELERAVLAGAAARPGRVAHRASTPATAATIPARSRNGLNEAELMLDVALRLEQAAREAAGHRSRA